MRKQIAGGKSILLAVIILAFFHWFSYHYGALSHKRAASIMQTFYTAKFQRTVLQIHHTMNEGEILCSFFMAYPKISKNG